MNLLHKKNNCQGQHTIEYVLLLTLVMVSIIVMGPYVIRAWNAHVKSYDDSIKDSMNEPLLQAPVPKLQCVCVNDTPLSCGDQNGNDPGIGGDHPPDTTQPDNGCGCNERLSGRACTFQDGTPGCDYNSHCELDNGCCCRRADGDCWFDASLNCDFNKDGVTDCGQGERCFAYTCGSDTAPRRYKCESDPAACAKCNGYIPDPKWRMCPGDSQNLPADTDMSVVGPGGCSDPPEAIKCEVECLPPRVPLKNGDPNCGVFVDTYAYQRDFSFPNRNGPCSSSPYSNCPGDYSCTSTQAGTQCCDGGSNQIYTCFKTGTTKTSCDSCDCPGGYTFTPAGTVFPKGKTTNDQCCKGTPPRQAIGVGVPFSQGPPCGGCSYCAGGLPPGSQLLCSYQSVTLSIACPAGTIGSNWWIGTVSGGYGIANSMTLKYDVDGNVIGADCFWSAGHVGGSTCHCGQFECWMDCKFQSCVEPPP